jgi:hypothetical protein
VADLSESREGIGMSGKSLITNTNLLPLFIFTLFLILQGNQATVETLADMPKEHFLAEGV